MSVAEAMGRALQQTSISTNIKERLDYSCALFGPDGDLVANAPFIPASPLAIARSRKPKLTDCHTKQVHLGSMSFAIKYQLALHGDNLVPGDVLLANSPTAGGSHLPDLTVITPVFESSDASIPRSQNPIIFFTASRGHHADIGGAQPGSMPSYSTSLKEEGAEIVSFKLVKEGVLTGMDFGTSWSRNPPRFLGALAAETTRVLNLISKP